MIGERFKVVTFSYPSKIIGGAELLFLRLAINLSRTTNCHIQYVDYLDGYVATEIQKNGYNIKIIPFNNEEIITLEKDSLLITPLSSIFQVARVFNKDLYVMCWSIHPMGLKEAIDLLPSHIPRVSYKSYGFDLTQLISKKGVFFMDKPNFTIQKKIFAIKQSEVDYLPIFSSDAVIRKQSYLEKSNELQLGWLGRLCIEKVNPLINVITHCNAYLASSPSSKIIFSIIGDGDKKFMVQNCDLHPNLELKYIGTLSGEHLQKFIVDKVDLMFAMGTSALEAGFLNIATVLVDLSFNKMPETNRFRYLYESVGYSVADEYHDQNNYRHDLSLILDRLKSGEIAIDAKRCYDYCLSHHSEESVVGKFCNAAADVQARVADVKHSKFGILRQLFVIKCFLTRIKRKFGYQ